MPTFTWNLTDADGDIIFADLYVGEVLADVRDGAAQVLAAEGVPEESFRLKEPLERGKEYYWTVIPYDGTEYGACADGVWSFTVENLNR